MIALLRRCYSLLGARASALVLCLLLVAGQFFYVRHELRAARAAGLRLMFERDSVAAAHDTTRVLLGVVSDSLRLADRLNVQTALERDALDKKLVQVSAVRASLNVKIDSLEHHILTAVVSADPNDSIRSATFQTDSGHLHVHVGVQLPHAPGIATSQISASIDPFRLSARVGCGAAAHANEVRPASLSIISPAWVSVSIDSVVQEPGVCNAAAIAAIAKPSHGKRNAFLGGVITTLVVIHFLF